MSNPVVEPPRKLRPRQAGLEPSGSLDSQPRTMSVFCKSSSEAQVRKGPARIYYGALCRRNIHRDLLGERDEVGGTLLNVPIRLAHALTAKEVLFRCINATGFVSTT